jgi:hypothetical protein
MAMIVAHEWCREHGPQTESSEAAEADAADETIYE